MEYPYCTVDGVKYQLYFDKHGTLRFPKLKESHEDLNALLRSYFNGDISLDVIWDEYTQTNSSYSLVTDYFTAYGLNNHTTSQGNGAFKEMVLHSGDPKIDASYNLTKEEKLRYEISNIVQDLSEEFYEMSKDEIIEILDKITNKVKKL